MRRQHLLALVAVLAAPSIARSDGLAITPGLWEFTTTVPSATGGTPTKNVHTECVRDESMTPQKFSTQMTGCRISDEHYDESSMSWKMSCPSPAGTVEGRASFRSTGTTVSGFIEVTMTMEGRKFPMKNSWTGRRLRDCP